MKKLFAAMAMVMILICAPGFSHAEQGNIGSLITTSLLGTGVGLLAGTATLMFTDNPGDHNDRAAYGAAIGFACGFALGLSGIIVPSYHSYTTNSGSIERIYGLSVHVPLM